MWWQRGVPEVTSSFGLGVAIPVQPRHSCEIHCARNARNMFTPCKRVKRACWRRRARAGGLGSWHVKNILELLIQRLLSGVAFIDHSLARCGLVAVVYAWTFSRAVLSGARLRLDLSATSVISRAEK